MGDDIRWLQRFEHYLKAFALLDEAVTLSRQRSLSDLEQQGLIQRFEFTHELAWNVLKDYLEFQGYTGITGSRDAVRLAFERGLIGHGELWMEMIKSRNQSSHTYNEEVAEEIAGRIVHAYHNVLRDFADRMKAHV